MNLIAKKIKEVLILILSTFSVTYVLSLFESILRSGILLPDFIWLLLPNLLLSSLITTLVFLISFIIEFFLKREIAFKAKIIAACLLGIFLLGFLKSFRLF